MIYVIFEWKECTFVGSFKNELQAQKAFGWLVKKYPYAKIKEIRSLDNAPTIRKLFQEGKEGR